MSSIPIFLHISSKAATGNPTTLKKQPSIRSINKEANTWAPYAPACHGILRNRDTSLFQRPTGA